MDAFFEYGDNFQSSKDFGLVLSSRPKLKKATRRNTNIVVAGRNGDLLTSDDSYNNMSLELNCNMKSKAIGDVSSNVDALYNWLDRGKYTPLSFFFDKEHYYMVAFQGDFESSNTRKTGTVTPITLKFTAKPFKYIRNVTKIEKTEKAFTVNNPYNRTSNPIIAVYGAGNFTLNVNGEKYVLTNVIDNIVIDSELFTSYRKVGDKVQSAEQNILNFTFPQLKPGKNDVSIEINSGSFTKIEINPRWVV